APTVIAATFGAADDFAIDGMVVAYWTNVDAQTGIATGLSVWTSAVGVKAVPTATATLDGLFAASDDGTRIVFSQAVTAIGPDLVLGTRAGTVLKTIAAAGNYTNCQPAVGFTKAIAFAQSCTGAAGTTATLRSVDTAAGTTVSTVGTGGVPG